MGIGGRACRHIVGGSGGMLLQYLYIFSEMVSGAIWGTLVRKLTNFYQKKISQFFL